jgi:hypothetical protein
MIQIPTLDFPICGFGSTTPDPDPGPWRHNSRDLVIQIPTVCTRARSGIWAGIWREKKLVTAVDRMAW